MSAPILMVAVPARLGRVLGTALQAHPELAVRDAVRMQRFRAELDGHTRARVHSERMPWDHDTDWVDQLVDTQVRLLAAGRDTRRQVWNAHRPTEAAAIQYVLGAQALVWEADPRHALRPDSDNSIDTAAQAGAKWARQRAAVRSLPGAVLATDPAEAVLRALGLAPDDRAMAALQLLQQLPAPTLAPPVLGALAAHPDVAATLRRANVHVPPPPDTAAVHVVRAEHSSEPHARIASAERALAGTPDPGLRARALDALAAAGEPQRARARLVRWMRSEDAVLAWERLLTNQTGPPEGAWLRLARAHPDERVRGALARWLVAEGLDRQAAETTCRVRGTSWFHHPREGSVAGPDRSEPRENPPVPLPRDRRETGHHE